VDSTESVGFGTCANNRDPGRPYSQTNGSIVVAEIAVRPSNPSNDVQGGLLAGRKISMLFHVLNSDIGAQPISHGQMIFTALRETQLN
jgi:hypothetical protein